MARLWPRFLSLPLGLLFLGVADVAGPLSPADDIKLPVMFECVPGVFDVTLTDTVHKLEPPTAPSV